MELLASSNRGGPQKCLRANLNVDRRWGMPVVLVVASISAQLATGCVSVDAPPGPASLVDLEPPQNTEDYSLDVVSIGDTFSVFIGAAIIRGSDTRQTLFEPTPPLDGPLVVNEARSASDNGAAWLVTLNDTPMAMPISVAIDIDPFAIDPHSGVYPTDFLLEFDPVVELADAQVIPYNPQPALVIPTETLVSPVLSSTIMTPRRDVWQGVMKATAVGFLAVVLLIPFGCSFAAGVVCSRRRARPRRRRERRRVSDRFLAGLSRAIANVPAH